MLSLWLTNVLTIQFFFQKKKIYVPTVWCCLVIFAFTVGLTFFFTINLHSFLALDHPVDDAQMLIVEGWLPDYALLTAATKFNESNYHYLVTTGGPLPVGYHLAEYNTTAELAAAIIRESGGISGSLVAIPSPRVKRNRTYASAISLRNWLSLHPEVTSANLVSLGPHSRRSYILFKKGLRAEIELGLISILPQSYPPKKWYLFSSGVRAVLSEYIAYLYVKIFPSSATKLELALHRPQANRQHQ